MEKPTLEVWTHKWLHIRAQSKCKPRTLENYLDAIQRLFRCIPEWKEKDMNAITNLEIQAAFKATFPLYPGMEGKGYERYHQPGNPGSFQRHGKNLRTKHVESHACGSPRNIHDGLTKSGRVLQLCI